MKYEQPIINALAHAQKVVQGGAQKGNPCRDGHGNVNSASSSAAAYEVDE